MIKMDSLKTVIENAGFQNVRTYIQSGNVFVDSEEEHGASVGFKIKQEIFKELGLEVPVVVVSKEDLSACLKNNPYLQEKECDTKKLYVAFLSKELQGSAYIDSLHHWR